FIVITHSPDIKYLTLERSFTGKTMFCEWTPTTHLNFDEGPEPDAEQFLHAVCRHLKIPETIEAPTRKQLFGMSKVFSIGGEMPTPLPEAEAAQVQRWEKMAEELLAGPQPARRSCWTRWWKRASDD